MVADHVILFKKHINYSMIMGVIFSRIRNIKATIVLSTEFPYFNLEVLSEPDIKWLEVRKLDPKNFEKWIICFSELQQRLEQDW